MERICKICGRPLSDEDAICCAPITYTYGYGSEYDGAKLELDLCSACLDSLTDQLTQLCRINPIVD